MKRSVNPYDLSEVARHRKMKRVVYIKKGNNPYDAGAVVVKKVYKD